VCAWSRGTVAVSLLDPLPRADLTPGGAIQYAPSVRPWAAGCLFTTDTISHAQGGASQPTEPAEVRVGAGVSPRAGSLGPLAGQLGGGSAAPAAAAAGRLDLAHRQQLSAASDLSGRPAPKQLR